MGFQTPSCPGSKTDVMDFQSGPFTNWLGASGPITQQLEDSKEGRPLLPVTSLAYSEDETHVSDLRRLDKDCPMG